MWPDSIARLEDAWCEHRGNIMMPTRNGVIDVPPHAVIRPSPDEASTPPVLRGVHVSFGCGHAFPWLEIEDVVSDP